MMELDAPVADVPQAVREEVVETTYGPTPPYSEMPTAIIPLEPLEEPLDLTCDELEPPKLIAVTENLKRQRHAAAKSEKLGAIVDEPQMRDRIESSGMSPKLLAVREKLKAAREKFEAEIAQEPNELLKLAREKMQSMREKLEAEIMDKQEAVVGSSSSSRSYAEVASFISPGRAPRGKKSPVKGVLKSPTKAFKTKEPEDEMLADLLGPENMKDY